MPASESRGRGEAGSGLEGGGIEPKRPGVVDELAGDPLVVLVAQAIAAEDQPIRRSRSQLGDKAHQIGATAPREEIEQKLKGDELYADSFHRLADHLTANGVNIDQSVLTLGPWLEMNTATERFVDNDGANKLLTREYRAGFVVPEAPA